MGAPLTLGPQEFLTVMIVHMQPTGIRNIYYLSVFISLEFQWLLLQVKSDVTFWKLPGFWICLFRFGAGSPPCSLSFPMGPRKVICFPLVDLFLVVEMRVTTSKLFTC